MANELYEKESFEIGVKYTEICKNLSLAMFFLPMVPFVVVIGLFINIAAFFMAQYTLSKRSNSKNKFSSDLAKHMTDEFEFCLLLYTCGLITMELILAYTTMEPFTIRPATAMLFAFALASSILLDSSMWQDWLWLKYFQAKKDVDAYPLSYDEMKQLDADDYDLTEPLNRKKALRKEWIDLKDYWKNRTAKLAWVLHNKSRKDEAKDDSPNYTSYVGKSQYSQQG